MSIVDSYVNFFKDNIETIRGFIVKPEEEIAYRYLTNKDGYRDKINLGLKTGFTMGIGQKRNNNRGIHK